MIGGIVMDGNINPLEPPVNCTICNVPPSVHDDWFKGYVGIIGVTFCDLCLDGITVMVTDMDKE
jgi:hypothetical protein